MKQRNFVTRTFLSRIPALTLALFLLVGCNSTGLPPTKFPMPTTVGETPTAIAALPQVSPTPRLEPTPQTEPTETPGSEATTEPQATAQADASPESEATAAPAETAQSGTVTPTPTVLPKAERVRVFEDVWDTVDSNYLYKDFHGANWQALHDKYLPLATNATTSDEFYNSISDMVDELKDDHSRYLSPQDAKEEDDLQSGNANYVGIGILSSPNGKSLMIVFVFPNSPAEKAGLKRRDRISAVDGVPFKDPQNEPSRIRGPAGSTVRLTVTSPGEQTREVSIVRGTITGAISPTASRLEVNPRIGFVIIPDLWTDDMGTRVQDELQTLLDDGRPLDGLVLDLRGNGGGFRTVLESVLSNFVTGEVGKFFNQKEQYPFVIEKSFLFDRLEAVPLAVLVDGGSESYTELLAGALQAKGRAKVVGVPTAGNTETIYRYDFEDGSRLWVAQESFMLPDGTNLEGKGVQPDFVSDKDWTTFTEKDDPDILKAVELLTK